MIIKETEYFGSMKPGQDLVAAGYIGLAGTAQIAYHEETELLKRFTKQYVKHCQSSFKQKNEIILNAKEHNPELFKECGASAWKEAGEGGIMAALWDFFEAAGLGFKIELRKLPLLQETVEVCEIFDVNPYRLLSTGCVLLTADHGNDLIEKLKDRGMNAVIIGKVEAGIKRQIYNGETRSFLDRPKPDELYKIQLAGGHGNYERENFGSH